MNPEWDMHCSRSPLLKLLCVAYTYKDFEILPSFRISQHYLEAHLYFQDMRGDKAKEGNLISASVQFEVEENAVDMARGEY